MLTSAPIGGTISSLSNRNSNLIGTDKEESITSNNEYLMNFSVVNIYRYGSGESEWRHSMAEAKSWEMISKSLEVLIQV